jgi:anti-sigma regulatory factor (Ser/Thr protein kinase)
MSQNGVSGRRFPGPEQLEERVDSAASEHSFPTSPAFVAGPANATVQHGHAAAVVGSDAELLATALPFLEAGLRAGDLVAIACPDESTALICEALGEQATLVESEPRMSLLGSRAPDALTMCRRYVERAEGLGSGRLRVLADIDFGSDPADWREGQRFEAVFNRLMGDSPVSAVCIYDERRLAPQVIESAAATHEHLVRGTQWDLGPVFQDPVAYVPALPLPREPVEDGEPVFVVESAPSLPGLRRQFGAVLATRVPDREQREDLHLAMAEIAANAFRHGTPPISARVWSDGDRIICTIADRGTTWGDPFSGYLPAHGFDLSQGGMGLWLARKLWDHVDVLPTDQGLTVRLSTRVH